LAHYQIRGGNQLPVTDLALIKMFCLQSEEVMDEEQTVVKIPSANWWCCRSSYH